MFLIVMKGTVRDLCRLDLITDLITEGEGWQMEVDIWLYVCSVV